ncbi:menaquinone-dependent protoporphyrinogen oxidase [Natronincola peptidivorans]|uniref:Menaquinone-dependent protoporphyrinogen oxidase n=1 Tax=Natronincola peptidivorans TaxID=426128 RepID=A0A1I0CC32_9FIRM|nr:flavodoxin domain-containing protein [Natronincola peptidivorans]SET16968.1 menaquinone-dependent protoporphyrinogen oxidase [Natronincola peptidivorans]
MKTLIAYTTKYGSTEKCAKALSGKLKGKVDVYNLKTEKNIDMTQYDKVIIGGSIYMGRIQKEATKFCSENLDVLQDKKVGLFICGMQTGQQLETQLNSVFPQELLSKSIATEAFGGEFIFKKMNTIDRFISKKISKQTEDVSAILEENITKLAMAMNDL